MRIKMFESFINKGDLTLLENNIKDILVELKDIGIDYYVSSHRELKETTIEIEICKEPAEREDDVEFDWGYEGEDESNLFNFEDIYEPVMTLLSFMRDKYPNVKIEPLMTVNNNPETDDWFEEFIEENDLESTTIDDVKEFTNISSFDIEFTF